MMAVIRSADVTIQQDNQHLANPLGYFVLAPGGRGHKVARHRQAAIRKTLRERVKGVGV